MKVGELCYIIHFCMHLVCSLLEQKGIALIFATLPAEMCSSEHQGGNANELGDDGGSSWKSSLFFVRSVIPGMLL
jgi:hypothetical protein